MNLVGNKETLKAHGVRKLLLNLSLGLILLFLTALGLAAAELISRLAFNNAAPIHKIFPEFSRAIYKTPEFDCEAHINRYGFRGMENRLLPGQVVVIGDSFAFGWGVSDNDTWPTKLQNDLSKSDTPIRVYNLGKPGADPDDYLNIARAYVPVLKPKVLLLSLLQADDLAQLIQKRSRKKENHDDIPLAESIRRASEAYFPGLTTAARSIQHPAIIATSSWETQVRFMLDHSSFFKLFNNRMAMLPPDIRTLTEVGKLNPGLISNVAEFPATFVAPYEDPEVSWLNVRVAKIVEEIERLVEINGGTLVLLSMPSGAYFKSETRENLGRMGFNLPALEFNKPDEFVDRLASQSHLKSILLAQKLQSRNDLNKIWYAFDGHPTKYGNEVLEQYIFEALRSVMVQNRSQ
jgi:hypothetical protein